jgi:uncharacterized membrane protein YkoI
MILALALALLPASAQEDGCLAPDAARFEVQAGTAAPFSAFRNEIAMETGGEILSADLCRRSGRLVYLVSVLVDGRSVINLTVDAQSGNFSSGANTRGFTAPGRGLSLPRALERAFGDRLPRGSR